MSDLMATTRPVITNRLVRHDIQASDPSILTDIVQEDTNIVIWQRSLTNAQKQAADTLVVTHPMLELSVIVSPQDAYATIRNALGNTEAAVILSEDIAALVDRFCGLFDLNGAILRLTALDRAMCPRFHVDHVPCRLITTYQGVATEWLPHHSADRTKLGTGNNGKPDELSGLYQHESDIQQLHCGDVALLKGEIWPKNEGAGLIHRSPQLPHGLRRLLLTMDFISD
jgi:hypothetical protein